MLKFECALQIKAQLAAVESDASSLRTAAARAEDLSAECDKLQQALEQAEEGRKAQVQEGRREQALLERQLQAAGRDRDQLAEQVMPYMAIVYCPVGDNMPAPFADVIVLMQPCVVSYDIMTTVIRHALLAGCQQLVLHVSLNQFFEVCCSCFIACERPGSDKSYIAASGPVMQPSMLADKADLPT